MKVPKTSHLDNLVSLIFKWANFYKQPYTYILNRPIQAGEDITDKPASHDYIFESLEDIIKNHPNPTLINIYDDLSYWIDTTGIIEPLFYMFTKVYLGKLGMEEIKYQYDRLLEHLNIPSALDLSQLEALYKHIDQQYAQQREDSIQKLKLIMDVQDYIESQKGLPLSPIKYTKRTANCIFTSGEYEAIDMFNTAKMSEQVTYLRIHNNESFKKDFYKIYNSSDYQHYSDKLLKFDASHEGVNLTLIVKVAPGIFADGGFDFITKGFKMIMPDYNKISNVLESVNKAFDNKIIMNDISYTSLGGNFNIYDVDITNNNHILLDEIMNQLIFNTYLYVEEEKKTIADRTSLIIHYNSTNYEISQDKEDDFYVVGDLNATLRPKYGYKNETYTVLNAKGEEITETFKKTTPYVEIIVTNARSETMFFRFQYLISKLLYHFVNVSMAKGTKDEPSVSDFYNENVPELALIQKKVTSVDRSSLQILKIHLPDVIDVHYASRCQKKNQPMVIDPSEVDEWKNKTFVDKKGHTVRYKVMPYPPVDPKVYLVCPSEDTPYPHGMKNKGDGKEEYPYLPCCTSSEPKEDVEDAYYSWKPIEKFKKEGKSSHIINNGKILDFERYGHFPSVTFSRIINIKLPENTEVYYMGAVAGKSSLIHCVLLATEDVAYKKLGTDIKREVYVKKLRKKMSEVMNPAVVRQEMHSYTDAQIRKEVADPEIEFDSQKLFRLIEVMYDVTLFVFDLSNNTLEIPFYEIFSVRPEEKRKSIILIKHTQKRIELEYPIYELVVATDDNFKTTTKIFSEEITKVLYDAYNYVHQNIIWMHVNGQITPYENIFSVINYRNVFEGVVGQWIDLYGKTRVFIFEYLINDKPNKVGIIVPPTMPLDLPIIDELPVVSLDTAVDLFGEPSKEDNLNGWMVGVWFRMLELDEGIYVPIEPIKNSFYPPGRPNPIITFKSRTELEHLQEMQKKLNIILDIITWIFTFEMEHNKYHPIYTSLTQGPVYYTYKNYVSNFARMYLRVEEGDDYDISKIIRRLPKANTVKEAIRKIHLHAPTLAGDGYIICYDEDFRDKLIGFLIDYLKANEGRVVENIRPKYIVSMFQVVSDFKQQENVYIFDEYRQLKAWTDQSKDRYNNYILTELKPTMTDLSPLTYKDDNNRIFIIQNTKIGFLQEALELCHIWREKNYNAGSSIVKDKNTDYTKYTYIKYYIKNGQIQERSRHIHPEKMEDEIAYEVIEIATGKIAALLPLR